MFTLNKAKSDKENNNPVDQKTLVIRIRRGTVVAAVPNLGN
jgi:hypothetical protein